MGNFNLKHLGSLFKTALLAATLIAVSCARTEDSPVQNGESDAGGGMVDSSSFQLNGTPVVKVPGKVYIACFYGKMDHGNVAEAKCNQMLQQCKERYGANKCQVLRNPDNDDLEKIGNKGIIIVVGHSTPNNMSPDMPANPRCRHDIWDTDVTPRDINNCGLPVVWYGCYGSGVAKECNRVIPLQEHPQILDSRDPEIACRFKATMYCYEQHSRSRDINPSKKIAECVSGMIQRMKETNDPYCRNVPR